MTDKATSAPAGKRLAPVIAEMAPRLRRFGELDIDDATAVTPNPDR